MRGAVAGDLEMLLVGALGRRSVGATSLTPPPTTTSMVPPLERTSSVLPAGTASGPLSGAAGVLVGGRQDDRRLAGIDRRRHPGIDPDIGRRQHPVPVEGGSDPHRALVAGGDKGRHHHHHDQRAQRPGIVNVSRGDGRPARMRLIEASVRSRWPATAPAPPGPCRQRVGQRGRRAMTDAGAAVEPAQALFAGRPAKANKRKQGAERQQHEQAGPTTRAINGSASHNPAQDTTRNSPTTVKSRARFGQARSHAIAYLARCRACVSCSRATASASRAGPTGQG